MLKSILLVSLIAASSTTPAVLQDDSKLAVRLVYAESFPKYCTKEDSTALFHLISETITSKSNRHRERSLRVSSNSDNNNNEAMDCSSECAWVGEGKCTVIKPWLAGSCNNWKTNRSRALSVASFGSFLEFQNEVAAHAIVVPAIRDDVDCTEAILNVRMALQDQKHGLSASCSRNVFGKSIEVQCFRGYV